MNLLFALIVSAVAVNVIDGQILGLSNDHAWESFKKQFNKNYNIAADGGKRDRTRKQIFISRCKEIKDHNSDPTVHYRREVNRFTDMLAGELKNFLGVNESAIASAQLLQQTIKPSLNRQGHIKKDVPYSLDYRYDPCLTDVKNQGRCGSCWAFAAITPVEFGYCKKNGYSVPLSEQQLIDCDNIGYNKGCNGGWPVSAWNYMSSYGVAKSSQYPYKNTLGTCKYNYLMKVTGVSTFNYIEPENVADIQVALVKFGPLATIFAVTQSFYSYAHGVYNAMDCDKGVINHAAVIVGWGNLNQLDYWIVRNSWGPGWGIRGYFLIQRGVNKCKIESYVSYVQVE